jgi:transcriptional regulator with XRE-family HTH domain
MKLDEFIRTTDATEQSLADATGYSQGTINRLRNGKINPTLELLEAVMRATDGAVTPNDFLSIEEPEQPSPFTPEVA